MADNLVYWMKAASWLNIALGAIIFFAPLFTGASAVLYANAMVLGLLVFILAVVEERSEGTGHTGRVVGTSIVNVIGGAWLIGLPFVAVASSGFMATCLTVGILLVLAEAFNLTAASLLQHRMTS
ncbi:MAG: SPW repeat domain-containing protein [Thermoplasmatota archaeon]